jgi:hypothetical protein
VRSFWRPNYSLQFEQTREVLEDTYSGSTSLYAIRLSPIHQVSAKQFKLDNASAYPCIYIPVEDISYHDGARSQQRISRGTFHAETVASSMAGVFVSLWLRYTFLCILTLSSVICNFNVDVGEFQSSLEPIPTTLLLSLLCRRDTFLVHFLSEHILIN